MRILVVDDHAVVRHDVKQILVEHFTTSLIGKVNDLDLAPVLKLADSMK